MKQPKKTDLSLLQLQAVTTLAARRAGEHVMANLHRRGDYNSNQRSDVKHKLDIEAQECAEGVIKEIFPEHVILGEESVHQPQGSAEWLWIIDPIDGTINFFHGLPWWCCSVAVRHHGKTIAGSVFIPEMSLMYEATCETQAICNGQVIAVSETREITLSMLATGADKWDLDGRAFRFMRKISEMAQRPRILGAAAVDLCMVASGRLDGYFESGIYTWDMAAGALIVERAGGRTDILKQYSGHRMAFLATNGHLHEICKNELLPMLEG
ncbi:MAG: inositol monophosphatase family protein [Kiritimatiellae bacterium]|nr:inositol monophosphatase family protein [Kiritimatiellia bacterium]